MESLLQQGKLLMRKIKLPFVGVMECRSKLPPRKGIYKKIPLYIFILFTPTLLHSYSYIYMLIFKRLSCWRSFSNATPTEAA